MTSSSAVERLHLLHLCFNLFNSTKQVICDKNTPTTFKEINDMRTLLRGQIAIVHSIHYGCHGWGNVVHAIDLRELHVKRTTMAFWQ